jgi:hypothetical protein
VLSAAIAAFAKFSASVLLPEMLSDWGSFPSLDWLNF